MHSMLALNPNERPLVGVLVSAPFFQVIPYLILVFSSDAASLETCTAHQYNLVPAAAAFLCVPASQDN